MVMLMARNHGRSATAAISVALLVLTLFLEFTAALEFVPGSPCASVCTEAGALEDDVVCLDENYRNTDSGRRLQDCVSCQLNSSAIDTARNETDVEWGLLALRYVLAGCMFAIPRPYISISSPCQVSCEPLDSAIGYQVTNNTDDAEPGGEFCDAGQFDSGTINICAKCYSFIPQQLFLANFLQALHISCRQPPLAGRTFFPDGRAIFNETLIAGPAPPSNNTGGGGGLHGSSLALAIALPIVGGILIIGGSCWCCYRFTRKRRVKMAQSGRMSRVHDANADAYSPMSPTSATSKNIEAWGQVEPPREMNAISPTSPGAAQGRWTHQQAAVDNGTPVRTTFPRDDAGPSSDQAHDPNLHERYFGISSGDDDRDDDRDDIPGPSTGHAQYPAPGKGGFSAKEEERGNFA